MSKLKFYFMLAVIALGAMVAGVMAAYGHGSAISPQSRVYRVYKSNPENPNFELAKNAVDMDGKDSYYTWNQVSRNIPEAVNAGLPEGFDYSPWVPDGQLASGGRVDPAEFGGLTYRGLDQVSADFGGAPGDVFRAHRVDPRGTVGITLAAVNIGIRRAIDHRGRVVAVHGFLDRLRIGDRCFVHRYAVG